MGALDKNYLRVQFQLKAHEKNAGEFQTFFEDIVQEAFPGFRKIRPYGKKGDAGNDGYRPDEGIYYQVYAPEKPDEKEVEAARKLKRDFEKLKKAWDKISEIKTFYFVFNDKYRGVSITIEEALAELKSSNPSIEFHPFLARDLENIFLTLKEETILSLGFDVDLTNSLRICRDSLAKLDVYLDRGNGTFVLESLQNSKDIIARQNDENLLKDWEILECRALQQLEKEEEARKKYESLCKRYPQDPRAFLNLAEIYLNAADFGKNEELLKEAEEIDNSHWLLRIEKLIRDLRLGHEIDDASIDEKSFPVDPKAKANYYRLYATVLAQKNDFVRAESFVERAIDLNPDRLANQIAKLSIIERRLFTQVTDEAVRDASEKLLTGADAILEEIGQWGKLSARNQIIFNIAKLKAVVIQEKFPEAEKLARESFELVMQCHFDVMMDHALTELLVSMELPARDFDRLLEFLRGAGKPVSDHLAKALVPQFILRKTLFSEGISFFEKMKKEKVVAFIADIKDKRYDEAWEFMKDDLRFAIVMANCAKDFPLLRRKIIENLPEDSEIQKERLWLLLNYDENNLEEAFDILRGFDFSKLKYFECRVILDIARQKNAWDFVILVAEKLISQEEDRYNVLRLTLELFNANLKLDRLPEVIRIGEGILSDGDKLAQLDDNNKEALLSQTILARMARGEYPQALALIKQYPNIPKTFRFKLGVETDVYLKNGDAKKAIVSIVDGVRLLKTPTPEHYSNLNSLLVQVGNMTPCPLDPLETFAAGSFVKFKDQERWYLVGDGDELDAIKIPSTDERYPAFLGKKIGDKVVFEFKYTASVEHTIENMLPMDKYIFLQSAHHFNRLSAEGNLKGVWMVSVPTEGGKIDTSNIVAFMEDTRGGRGEFFDRYCQENYPLAFLAAIEGGLTEAIGVIQNEGRGFIRFSSGDPAELDAQKEVAKKIIGGAAFYMDGISALILAESGLLEKIYPFLPNLKVPQSVIAMLFKCKAKFRYVPGQVGHMQYAKGQLRFSGINTEMREGIGKNFEKATVLLESKPQNIGIISAASKVDCFTEQKVPAETSDACILAQRDGTAVLTEDFLYLQVNAMETGKIAPAYCSAFSLARVLYEQNRISFDTFLAFFAYLSSYRFRFLPVTVEDMGKAVFGDGIIAIVQPEKIRWFNFSLTLAESYGVPFAVALRVMATFLIQVLTDDSLLPDVAERIFLEILSSFPTDKDRRSLGKLLFAFCIRNIEKLYRAIHMGTALQDKIERLSHMAEIYTAGNSLWTPPN